jgi:DNA-binding transcriptional ArsR family regulator
MPGFLLAGTLAAAVPWWWHHRIRPIPAEPPPGDWAEIWASRVAGADGALPGSHLTDHVPTDVGWTATVELPPGKATTTTAVTATERIASAYGRPLSSIVVEPTASGDASRARLMVLTTNPLEAVQPWPGPQLLDLLEGTAPIGVYPDGEQARFRFWRQGSGGVHSLTSGTTGSGKSIFIGMKLGYERHSGDLICSWVCDPQGGQSLPDWIDHVDFAARTAEEGAEMLRMGVAVMYARNDFLARVVWTDDRGRRRVGKGFFEPTPEMPLLRITIEEGHRVMLIKEAVAYAEEIANMGRKCGVCLDFVTQVPLLSQLGNSTPLRAALAGGNVTVFRTADRLTGQVSGLAFDGDVAVDPYRLPRQFRDGSTTAGLGYTLGGSDRPAIMRAFYDADPFAWATSGETVRLDALSAAAAAVACRVGIDYGAPRPGDVHHSPAADTRPVAGPRRPARDAVVDYLHTRAHAHTGVIARDLDLPLPTVSKALSRLASAGLVRPVRHGVWALATSERDSEASA